ncbi:DUF1489 family protein [Azospirillum sp. SYSU D00513]|uniref:DUF1489 family protein n=1 Tax=Azospirillum sp. SYSU D00513 TaxID=2812561 RepID=UPI001A9753D2|nr:DUF1489 family protein [Azospirillum sp. SYSU D00513]
MTLHILKTAVGIKDIDGLRRRQSHKVLRDGETATLPSITRRRPRRAAELDEDSCVYWVIKGMIRARQTIVEFIEAYDDDGDWIGVFVLDAELVPVRPVERKGFQGWHYLEGEAVPRDARPGDEADAEAMPADMEAELRELGLL